jgi:hypothetical protein
MRLSQVQNGESSTWTVPTQTFGAGREETVQFLQTYIIPYVKNIKFHRESGYMVLTLPNSIITYWAWDPGERFEVYTRFKSASSIISGTGGVDFFVFSLDPKNGRFEPYGYTSTQNRDLTCASGQCCNPSANPNHALCLLIIQRNGWKIPDNYPFKF